MNQATFRRGIQRCVLALLMLTAGAGAMAQERKAYRHVDAAGNVTYSQTPPVESTASKQLERIDISPAQRGRGGDTGSYSAYDNPNYYSGRYDRYTYPSQRSNAAYEQRFAALKAECERQRGTDCNNPAALQYLDSTRYPRTGVVVRPPQRFAPTQPGPRRDG